MLVKQKQMLKLFYSFFNSNFYVRADKVLKLRTLLDKVTDIAGLMTEEKDPEEFLNCLFQKVLQVEPYLHLK